MKLCCPWYDFTQMPYNGKIAVSKTILDSPMASDPDAPYKSRLFNFLNRQSILWNDRWERTYRYARVAATWGAQVLLYPVYMVVQTGKLAQKQLGTSPGSTPSASLPPETSPEETPVESVLHTVESWLPGKSETKAIKAAEGIVEVGEQENSLGKITIQGVACLTDNRSLVLVSNENQVLDVLTPHQQSQLQQRISWETANYLRNKRLAAKSEKSPFFAPVKLFGKVINWVKTSPVAGAINLFGESKLVSSATPNLQLPPQQHQGITKANLPDQGLLLWLDNALVNLEQRQSEFIQQIQPPPLPNADSNEPGSIQNLIRAAIEYFFPPHPQNNPIEGTPGENSPKQISQPWLSWHDLFAPKLESPLPKQNQLMQAESADLPQIGSADSLPPSPGNSVQDLISNSFNSLVNSVSLSISEFPEDPQPSTTSEPEIKSVAITDSNSSSNQSLEKSTQTIETQVTTTGYFKHPLVHVLEWLDQAMLWIEERFVSVWQKFRNND